MRLTRSLRIHAAATALLLAAAATTVGADPFAENVRTTPALSPEEQRKAFHLPPGFEITLVASEPQIAKPMNLAFDAKGRLWVTESNEYPFPAKPGTPRRDAIKVLEDADGDGRAEKVRTFADGLNIPLGIYPYKDGCIAYSIPEITFFRDTDGDGRADVREVLYSGFGSRDTHGMTNSFRRGYDGWLYATHGFNNESNIKAAHGDSSVRLVSGNIYRMRVDGTRVEQWAWGPVNPFGMSFDSLGNMYISDCHSQPITNILRGGWYPHFGNPHDGLGFAPNMMNHAHGSTAIAGTVVVADERWPRELWGNMFVGNVMTSRINRDAIVDKGSTRIAVEAPDFLRCDDPWFRPVDLQLGPDGAIYVADFYNRIIGHYEVPLDHPGRDRERARIWRITYKDANAASPVAVRAPDLSAAPLDALVKSLAHHNQTIRFLAADQITDRIGAEAVPALQSVIATPVNALQKVHALWLLHRFDRLPPDTARAAGSDGEVMVRAHAMRIMAETREVTDDQRALLRHALTDSAGIVRRCAADALGRHVHPDNLRPLLDLLHRAPAEDTHLIHTARMAVRDHFRDGGLYATLPLPTWGETDAQAVAGASLSIHSVEAANYLLAHVRSMRTPGELPAILRHVARNAPAAQDDVLAIVRARARDNPQRAMNLLKAVHEGIAQRGGSLSEPVRAFAVETITTLLTTAGSDARQAAQRRQGAIDLARAMNLGGAVEAPLLKLLAERSADGTSRGQAARLLVGPGRTSHVDVVTRILGDATEASAVREQAAEALAEVDTPAQHAALLEAMNAAPHSLQVGFAQALAARAAGAEALVKAIEAGKASASLLLEQSVKERLHVAKLADVDQRIAKLTKGLLPLDEKLDQLIAQRRSAFDPSRADRMTGVNLFVQNCAACHSIGGNGGTVGPQLDGIGARGTDRLVEDLLDPNRNVDPAFYYSIVDLKDGSNITGLKRREEGETIVFADSTGKEITVQKKDIKRRRETRQSLMPTNFHELMSPQDFNHLLAYLLSQRDVK
jgi:putative heme-binding domain-containing protein